MKAVVITKHGPPEVLKVQERPDPIAGPGEIRIAVKAAGINFADLLARTGMYPDAPKTPSVVGYEVAGVVESLGEGVTKYQVGDRVIGGTKFGGYAELVVSKVDDTLPLADRLSFEQGAAIPVNYGTAYAGLVLMGGLRAGDRVLIHAAAGGVGISATQVAKHVGAEVFGTASPSKHDAIRGFGIEHAIDYRSQDPAKEIRRITGEKRPLDLVMDAIGGNSLRKSFGLLGAGGRLVAYGLSEGGGGERREIGKALKMVATTPIFPALQLMSSSKSVIGLNMLTIWDAKGSLDEYITPLIELMEQGVIDPVVSEAFPIEKAADAHRYMSERKNVGKVVLTL